MTVTKTPKLKLDALHKKFADVVAVDDVDFTVREGEFFSLLGPSGCGKTTTLRLISGFERPTSGNILFDGINVTRSPPNKRDTNLVFQHLSLFPHISVKDNIEYGLEKDGVDKEERERRVTEFLKLVDLEGFEDRNPEELSGGQQQRVALARALVNEPNFLLLDEPLASLDRKLRQRMQMELRRLHDEVGGIFFYVTHNQETAMALSDRMAIMRDGQIEQIGTPKEIYHEPINPFVADFVGDTNLLNGQVRTENNQQIVEIGGMDGFRYVLTDTFEEKEEVTVSIRPEHFHLTNVADTSIVGEVNNRYFQGDQVQYEVTPNISNVSNLTIQSSDLDKVISEGTSTGIEIKTGTAVIFSD